MKSRTNSWAGNEKKIVNTNNQQQQIYALTKIYGKEFNNNM